MTISFGSERLREQCTNERERLRAFGKARGRALGRRLDDLDAAENLSVMRNLPGRCHELKGDRAGQFALDLGQPYRLVFEPDHDPVPQLDGGGTDWEQITAIRIIEVVDYHD